jgi:hypothetical protein
VKFKPGTPVTLRGARSWHGIVIRRADNGLYDVDFGTGFAEAELMEDPTMPHSFVEGRMYGPGKCAFSGCGAPITNDVHDPRRVEIEQQRRALDPAPSSRENSEDRNG